MRTFFLAGVVSSIFATTFLPTETNAATISVVQATNSWVRNNLDLTETTTVAEGTWSQGTPRIVDGSRTNVYRSPFEGYPRRNKIDYFVVGLDKNAPSVNSLEFSVPANEFSFFWGSPDTYNTLSFLNNGNLVVSYTGSDVTKNLGSGAVWFALSDILFDEVKFATTQQAFEFSNIEVNIPNPIPLPAAGWMLLSALVGTYILNHKRVKETLV